MCLMRKIEQTSIPGYMYPSDQAPFHSLCPQGFKNRINFTVSPPFSNYKKAKNTDPINMLSNILLNYLKYLAVF